MTETPTTEREVTVSIRMPETLAAELRTVARDNERSFSAEARLAIKAWLERYQGQAPS